MFETAKAFVIVKLIAKNGLKIFWSASCLNKTVSCKRLNDNFTNAHNIVKINAEIILLKVFRGYSPIYLTMFLKVILQW